MLYYENEYTTDLPMRVFIGFSEVAGYYTSLCEGLEGLGHKVVFFSFGRNPYNYKIETTVSFAQAFIWKTEQVIKKRRHLVTRKAAYMFHVLARSIVIMPSMMRSDLILLNYCGTLCFYIDIAILKLLGKKIVYIFHGTDARPPCINGKFIYPYYNLARLRKMTLEKHIRIRIIECLSSARIVQPSCAQMFRRPILNYNLIGNPWPASPSTNQTTTRGANTIFTIVHAPSNPQNKGTVKITNAVNSLHKKGYDIRYVLIENRPNEEVRKMLEKADLLVDELWSDTRIAGLAAEAASLGVPTLVGSYYTQIQWDIDSDGTDPLVFVADPDNIELHIESCIIDKQKLVSVSENLLKQRNKHFPISFAMRFLEAVSSNKNVGYNQRWLYNTNLCSYLFGWGAPSNHVTKVITEYVQKYGVRSLHCNPGSDFYHKVELLSSKSKDCDNSQ
jgi:hypothetical protein